jgi:hypothetical protein
MPQTPPPPLHEATYVKLDGEELVVLHLAIGILIEREPSENMAGVLDGLSGKFTNAVARLYGLPEPYPSDGRGAPDMDAAEAAAQLLNDPSILVAAKVLHRQHGG